jgi:hypothetical protein
MKASRRDWYEGMDVNIHVTIELSHGFQKLIKQFIEAVENQGLYDHEDQHEDDDNGQRTSSD